jgi:cytoskeletal protein CcmA (bactofilin family)
MFKKEEPDLSPNPDSIRTMIAEGTNFKGVLSFDGSVRIDGRMEGEIVSNGTLFVGHKSVIQADIKVDSITIGGKICGNIIAATRLVMLSTAEVNGKIQTPILKIEEGAKFQGTCKMRQDTQETKSIPYNDSKTEIVEKAEVQVNNTPIKEVQVNNTPIKKVA